MSSTTVDTRAAFKKVLFERLNRFFEENRLSKKGNWEMTLKVTFAIAWWLSTYILLFAADWTYTQFFIIYLLQGLGQIFMFLNISHDANHNAISNNRTVNKILSYSLDVCGISSYMWRIMHNKGHHAVMNVYGDDEGIFAPTSILHEAKSGKYHAQKSPHRPRTHSSQHGGLCCA